MDREYFIQTLLATMRYNNYITEKKYLSLLESLC